MKQGKTNTKYPTLTQTDRNIYNDINMITKHFTNVGKLAYSSGLSSEFIKTNDDLDNNVYITASDAVTTALQNKMHNFSGSINETI